MLIWLVLIPLIAAALIGLCKAPARPTALLSAALTLALGIWALVSFDGCSSCWSRFEGMDLQLTLAPALAKVMLLLTILVTFATVLGTNPPQGGEASWYNSALLISAGATGAFLSDNIISFFAFHELALIPTFVMIGLYGRGDRRTTAWRATLYLGLASMVLLAALPSASNVSLLTERYGAHSGRVARIILVSTSLAFLSFSAAVALMT